MFGIEIFHKVNSVYKISYIKTLAFIIKLKSQNYGRECPPLSRM